MTAQQAILDALMSSLDECCVSECSKPVIARGYCHAHYRRFMHTGNTGGPLRTSPGVPLAWVEKHKDDGDGPCLIWPFGFKGNGYGQVSIRGRKGYAHRAMCEAVHGPPPFPNAEAAHSCGNGNQGCVHPRHLRWATHRENEADKIQHGTNPRGERAPAAKLTAADVIAIRRLASRITQNKIAAVYGVSQAAVSDIVCRRRWAWLQSEDAA